MLKLRIVAGPDVGKEYRLNEGETVIGRGGSSNIILPEPQVSTRHAQITIEGDQWHITDLSSTNGTILNGQRIRGKVTLSLGDRIKFGSYETELIEVSVAAPRTQLMGSAGKRCPACGTMNPASAVECVHCSVNLITGEKPAAEPKAEAPAEAAAQVPSRAPTTVAAKPTEKKKGLFARLFGKKK